MLMTLTGDNSFALHLRLRSLVEAFVKKYGDLSLQRLDGQEASYEQIVEAMNSLPFLTSRKLLVLRTPSSHKKFTEEVGGLLESLPETNDVILVEPQLDKRLNYYKTLVKQTDFQNFAQLDTNGLIKWLTTAAKEKQGLLNLADARYLVERLGTDQQLLASELEKLLLYDPHVTRQNINLLTEPTPQSTVFELLEAAFAGNTKLALGLYDEQRALKVEPPRLIALLTWQLQVLAIIKTAGERSRDMIAREARLNPYVVSKSQPLARELSLSRLKKLISDLLFIDIKTKSTGIDADEALKHYLLSLSS